LLFCFSCVIKLYIDLHFATKQREDAMIKVLIVEGSPLCRELAALICRLDGHSTTTVASGQEALARLESESFGLVLLGIFVPGIDGEELLRLMRSGPNGAGMPIIVLSSVIDRATIARLWRDGAADVVLKPYVRQGLRRSIAGVLAHAA
jgi:CheY-like chemotaxis protein